MKSVFGHSIGKADELRYGFSIGLVCIEIMNKTEEFYENVGASGLRQIVEEFGITGDIEFVKERVQKNDKILDLACGYGRVTLPLAQEGYDVVGIDISENLIADARTRAKQQGLSVQFDVGSMTALPYEEESFDRVFCLWNSFNELLTKEDQLQALEEIYRVLRNSSGEAFLSLLNGEDPTLLAQLSKDEYGEKVIFHSVLNDQEMHQYVHTPESIKALMEKAPFTDWSIGYFNIGNKKRLVLQVNK